MQEREPTLERILNTLREPAVQARLQERQRQLQENLTTSIGQLSKALGVTEAQLRNWEKQKALVPERAPSKGQEGQRRYGPSDLKKLVVIDELLRRSYSLSDIASFMAEAYGRLENGLVQVAEPAAEPPLGLAARLNQAEQGFFWRFFVPQLLYFAIRLIFQAPPTGDAGLFLPVRSPAQPVAVPRLTQPKEVARLGKTLLGWHGRDRTFNTFLPETGVELEYPDLYHLISLDALAPRSPATGAYLVTEWKLAEALTKPEHLALSTTGLGLNMVQRLLELLQGTSAEWSPALQSAANYMVYHAPDFTAPTILGDPVLTKMTEIVVRAGGTKEHSKEPKWRFACILLPNNPAAPVHQWNLVVQAQSAKSPHQTGVTTLSPNPQTPISLSQRALHSGHITYRSDVSPEDLVIVSRRAEEPIRSAIAVPLEGVDDHSLGVLYVVSDEPAAFSEDDQRLLRVLGKMIGEIILTYQARRLPPEILRGMIQTPQVVERTLEDFAPENAFISRLEGTLEKICVGEEPLEYLSLIAIDIDDHRRVAHKFGDWAARNLIWEVGHEIKELFRVHSRKPGDLRLYRVYADRFYLVMNNFPLGETRDFASRLKRGLTHPYRIKAAYSIQEEHDNTLNLDVTMRLGMTNYDLGRLQSFLRLSNEPAIPTVRAFLTRALDQALLAGKNLGGNVIITWDPETRGFIRWPPATPSSLAEQERL